MFLNYYYFVVVEILYNIIFIISVILNFLFFLGSIIIDINIAYTIVWIFIFPIHLKSLVMHMCKKRSFWALHSYHTLCRPYYNIIC